MPRGVAAILFRLKLHLVCVPIDRRTDSRFKCLSGPLGYDRAP